MSLDDVNKLLSGSSGPPSFFNSESSYGDTIKGTLVDAVVRNATDPTGNPKTFSDGNPIKEVVLTIRDDDGSSVRAQGGVEPGLVWRWFLSRQAKDALIEAIRKATDGTEIANGARIAGQYFDEEPQAKGLNPRKLYRAEYSPPPPKVTDVGSLL